MFFIRALNTDRPRIEYMYMDRTASCLMKFYDETKQTSNTLTNSVNDVEWRIEAPVRKYKEKTQIRI